MKVVLGFDMETDSGSWTPYYEGLVNGTPLLLDVLRRHDAKATFYFTGEAAKEHPEVARSVLAEGHEVGAHSLYHETVGESLFPIPGMRSLLPEEVPFRLRVCTEWVERAAGVRPVAFRAPRLFGGTAVVNALEGLGYETDASYPMYFYQERLTPYHPDRSDWSKEGDSRILEIPNFADMTIESKDQYGRDRDQWPLFRTENAESLLEHVDAFVGYVRKRNLPVVLCFYFHPWEFWPMPQGLIHYGEGAVYPDPFLVQNCGPYAVKQLDKVMDGLARRGAEFVTAHELAAEWE